MSDVAVTQAGPRRDCVGAGDRVQIASPLVQYEVDLHERL